MTDPIDRSIPPEITTTACAAAAQANGNAAIATDCASNELNAGWIATVAARKDEQQDRHAEQRRIAGYGAPDLVDNAGASGGPWRSEDELSADAGVPPVARRGASTPWSRGHAVRDAHAMRGAQQGSLIRLAGRHLSDDFAPEQDDRPVANEAYFRKLGREQQHGRPGVGHLTQQPIDLMLGADIDAAGRIEAKQGLKPGGNPSRDHHLLLVAAAQPAQFGPRAGVDLQVA